MNIHTIKTVDGQEFVLLPIKCYEKLKPQIDKYLEHAETKPDEYIPFVLKDYVSNPVALARINAGVTQKELSDLLNVSQAYVSKLESSSRVSAKTMMKVKEALKSGYKQPKK